MEMLSDMAGPKATGTTFQKMLASMPSVGNAASSSAGLASTMNSSGINAGGFGGSASWGLSCQPLPSAPTVAEAEEEEEEEEAPKKKARTKRGAVGTPPAAEATPKAVAKSKAKAKAKASGPGRPKRDVRTTWQSWLDTALAMEKESPTFTSETLTESRWLKRHPMICSISISEIQEFLNSEIQ